VNDSVFRVAAKRGSDGDPVRDALLAKLGNKAATRPFDEKELAAAAAEVKEAFGEGVMVEAAAAAGAMECTTKIVTMSGKDPIPPTIFSLMRFVLTFINWFLSFFR